MGPLPKLHSLALVFPSMPKRLGTSKNPKYPHHDKFKVTYSLGTSLKCKLLKHISSWRRLFLWNRHAHNHLPFLKHLKCCSDYLAWGYIILMQLYTFEMKFTCKWSFPITISHGTCNNDIPSMFPLLLVLPFKNQITISAKEQEVFYDPASWLQNNLCTARINLEDWTPVTASPQQHWAQDFFKISEFCNWSRTIPATTILTSWHSIYWQVWPIVNKVNS